MKYAREFVTSTLVGGLLIVVPVYLAVLLLLKGMKSAAGLVRPVAALLPDWIPAERFFSLVLVLAICFLVGIAVRTRSGREVRERMEVALFGRPIAGPVNASTRSKPSPKAAVWCMVARIENTPMRLPMKFGVSFA